MGLDDNRSALLKAASVPPEQQARALREIASAKLRAKQSPPPPEDEDQDDGPEIAPDETEAEKMARATLINAARTL